MGRGKLQTGKQITASEEINRTIAEVCGGNADQLVWDGYMEKAPSIIRDYVNATLPSLKETMNMVFPLMFPPEQATMLCQYIDNMSPVELIKVVHEQSGPIIGSISNDLKLTEIDGEQVDIDLGQTVGIPMMDDSMEPVIPYKSVIKYEPIGDRIIDGSIVVVRLKENAYIRRCYEDKGILFLIPENKSYTPFISEISNIIGIVNSCHTRF